MKARDHVLIRSSLHACMPNNDDDCGLEGPLPIGIIDTRERRGVGWDREWEEGTFIGQQQQLVPQC